MKRILYIMLILAVAVMTNACMSEDVYWETPANKEGAANINIGFSDATRADINEYPWTVCNIRIYALDNNTEKGRLVRQYTKIADMPGELWLTAGEYRIDVTLGDDSTIMSFDKKYYHGESKFTIKPGASTAVSVTCKIQNTGIKIVFSDSVHEYFNAGYSVKVMIGSKFDAAEECLTYTATKTGYFIIPAEQPAVAFCFDGTLKEDGKAIHHEGKVDLNPDKLLGYLYEINFKYTVTDPEDGYISFNFGIVMDELTESEDIKPIDPDLEPDKNVEGVGVAKVTNAWDGICELTAYSELSGEAKIQYCESGTEEWIDLETTVVSKTRVSSDGTYYHAYVSFSPGKTYDYRLTIDGEPTGVVKTLAIPAGPQIPNGDFEQWTKEAKYSSPYIGNKFWDTGNKGSTTLSGDSWITQPQTGDIHPGSEGSTYAYLRTEYVVIKNAAGNIFIGNFLGTIGMKGGAVAFGREFTFTYKPKKLRFWVKGTAGSDDTNHVYVILAKMKGPHIVNTTVESSLLSVDNAPTEISYCPNITTDTASIPGDGVDPNTAKDGKVIAYGGWDNSGTIGGWTSVEIELNYNDEYDEIPNYLIINCTSSKDGDHFNGSTSSNMSLDDFEFVY